MVYSYNRSTRHIILLLSRNTKMYVSVIIPIVTCYRKYNLYEKCEN